MTLTIKDRKGKNGFIGEANFYFTFSKVFFFPLWLGLSIKSTNTPTGERHTCLFNTGLRARGPLGVWPWEGAPQGLGKPGAC